MMEFLIHLICKLEANEFHLASWRSSLIASINGLVFYARMAEQSPASLFDHTNGGEVQVLGEKYRSHLHAVHNLQFGALLEIADAFFPDWYDLYLTPIDALQALGVLEANKATCEAIGASANSISRGLWADRSYTSKTHASLGQWYSHTTNLHDQRARRSW